jgi:hypothetical protein
MAGLESLSLVGCSSLIMNYDMHMRYAKFLKYLNISGVSHGDGAFVGYQVCKYSLALEALNISENPVTAYHFDLMLSTVSATAKKLVVLVANGVRVQFGWRLNWAVYLQGSALTHLSVSGSPMTVFDLMCVITKNPDLTDLRKDDLLLSPPHPTVLDCSMVRHNHAAKHPEGLADKGHQARFDPPPKKCSGAFAMLANYVKKESGGWVVF